ncbi:MAK10-like protein [Tanacetum coccineum]|uniref:MAK10-like protein n=1 Tax=Tanacetum coccineum TaxID=301880 RepID=A0ABQ5HY34_9ASTR
MGDAKPIRTLGDYSKPSHEGNKNTIQLPEGNNVAPLRSDTIRLVQNGCSFHGLRSKDPYQHLKDFLKLMDSLELDDANRKRTRLQAWTRFKDLLQKFPHHGIDRWLQIQIFYEHVSFHLKCDIDHAASGKLSNKSTNEYWEIIENLALYDHEGWNESKNFVKPTKLNTHPQAYTDAVYSNPHPRNQNEPPKQKSFTFHEHTGPNPQPQALGTNFEARVSDYMAAHIERMERFENAIFKQREEINDRMAEMFGLLKELTTSRAPEKVLIREEAKYPITKNVNSLSLTKGEEEKNDENDVTTINDIEKTNRSDTEMLVKKVEKENEAKNGTKNETTKRDVLVDIIGYVYPVDFVILDIREDEKRPFILGTPFLTTAKAVIKFDKDTITLRSRKSKISFNRIPESLGKVKKGIKNDIEPIAPTMTVNRLVLEWEERIKLHQEKEMEFDQWRSKNFKNKHPALVKVKGEKNEGEVTKAHLLDDKPIPSVGVFDEMFLALGWHLEEIHVTWAHLEKIRTKLRTYTKSLEESCSQSVETASQA